jgi:hypothetical protein
MKGNFRGWVWVGNKRQKDSEELVNLLKTTNLQVRVEPQKGIFKGWVNIWIKEAA